MIVPTTDPRFEKLTHGMIVNKYGDRGSWLAARRDRLGASQIADLFGLGWTSEYELWMCHSHPELAEGDDTGASDPWERENVEWGRRMEGAVLDGLADRQEWDICPWPQTWTVGHPSLQMAATPDAIAWDPVIGGDPMLVEVKYYSEFAARNWGVDDEGQLDLPPKIRLQVQGQMECTGIHWACVAVMLGGNRLELVFCRYHAEFCSRMREVVVEFWRRVAEDDAPEPDGSEATRRSIQAMYPKDLGHGVDLRIEMDAVAQEFIDVRAERIALEKREKALKNKLCEALGNASYGITPSGLCFSLKTQSRTGVNVAKLAAEFPEVHEACQRVSTFRKLLPVKKVPGGVEFSE